MLKPSFLRFAYCLSLQWKPLLYLCYLMFNEAIGRLDFIFWTFRFFMVEWRYAVHVETLVHFPEFSFDYVCFLMLNTSCSCLMIDWGMLEMMIRMLHSQTLDVWILPRKFEVDWLVLILLLFHWIWTNHNISWPRPKLCRFVKWRGYLPICHAVNHVWPPFHVFCSCFIQYFTHLPKFIFNSF